MSSRRYDQKDLLFDDLKLTEAYVFPQRPHDEEHAICPYLAKLFRLTEPRSYFLFSLIVSISLIGQLTFLIIKILCSISWRKL